MKRILARRRRGRDDSGFILVESLVTVALVAGAFATFAGAAVVSARYISATVDASGARTVNQDALGYLAAAPANVVEHVAPADGGWANAPASVPGLDSRFSTKVQIATAVTDPELSGSDLAVSAKTCYTPMRGTQRCLTDSIVRPGMDMSITAPTNLDTVTPPCDGQLTVTNDCVPVLSTRLSSDNATVDISLVRPQPDAAGDPISYTIQREALPARADGSAPASPADFSDATTVPAGGLADAATVDDTVAAAPAHDTFYYYRARYNSGTVQSPWSPTARIRVPASHPACTLASPSPASQECTPALTIGTPRALDASHYALALTVLGPRDQVTYTVQRSTDSTFATATTTTTLTWTAMSTPATVTLPTAGQATTWFYRVAYAADAATGKQVWSPVQSITAPAT